jgi:fumarylacetoacetase
MSEDDGFGPGNLPYGVSSEGRVVVAYRDKVVDLAVLSQARQAPAGAGPEVFGSGSLNAFMSLGPQAWAALRRWLAAQLQHLEDLPGPAVLPRSEVELVLPIYVTDYADFYSCEAHVVAMGKLLRPGEDPLPPAWRHIPIGYHGRSSSVIVSGEGVARPAGVVATEAGPELRPAGRLDVEVELGFVVGTGNPRNGPVPAALAEEHLFGVVVMNDWSARDIQAFEYRPLGPFLGKSFATSVSPWVVPLEALAPWRVPGPPQDPEPAAYLQAPEPRGLDVTLELLVNGTVLSRVRSAGLYWAMAQQFAHLTINGAATRTGELFGSGAISEQRSGLSAGGPGSAGSLMELTLAGEEPLTLDDGTSRTWLEDGDEVVIRGWCGERGSPGWVSLGEVRSRVLPAVLAPAVKEGSRRKEKEVLSL